MNPPAVWGGELAVTPVADARALVRLIGAPVRIPTLAGGGVASEWALVGSVEDFHNRVGNRVGAYTLAIDLEGAALRVVGCAPMPGAGLGSSMQRVEGETVETWVGTEGSTTHVVVRRPELELHVMGDVSFRRAIQLGLATEFLFPA